MCAGGHYLATPHAASLLEIDTFWRVVSLGLINGGLAWILYLALEPWVRKLWPHTLIGWTRYAAKGVRDPLVGRDLLIGIAAGTLLVVGDYIQVVSHGAGGAPNIPDLDALTGVRQSAFLILNAIFNSLFLSVLLFFLFFVLRLVLRLQWLAAIVFVAISTLIFNGSGSNWLDISFLAAFGAMFAVVLLRFGFLALMVMIAVDAVVSNVPWTADPSALNLAVLAIVAIIAVYAARTALAGRPILRGDLL